MAIIDELKKIVKRKLTRKVDWMNLRSVEPVSKYFGFERGVPIDRYYIEKFLSENRGLIKGSVLEVADSSYTKKFDGGVEKFEVLYVDDTNLQATIIGDLSRPETLPECVIDCFICTQTFNFIYDFKSAIKGAHKLLKPGGTLLATCSGISQISRYDMDRWGDYWRFTTSSARLAFGEAFGGNNLEVKSYGNVLASVAFLEGMACEELNKEELDFKDDDYQMIISVKALKR